MRANQSADREARSLLCGRGGELLSLASCANGPCGCIEGAVAAARDTFISRLEKATSVGRSDECPAELEEVNGDGVRVVSSL